MASPHDSPHRFSGASSASRAPGAPAPGPPTETALAGDFRVLTPERVGLQYAIAGIGSRSIAALIDTLLLTLVIVLWSIVVFAGLIIALVGTHQEFASRDELSPVSWAALAVFVVVAFVILFGYFILFEMIWSGQTPGKRLLGLRVIRENGYPIRPTDAVVRNLVRIVDVLATGYAIGLLTMLLNERAKRLGDFAAGTLVVREASLPTVTSFTSLTALPEDAHHAPARTSTAPSSAASPQSSGPGTSYRLPTLAPEHATLVRDFLLRRDTLDATARRRLAARLAGAIAAHYGLESLRASEDDEAFLARFTAG